MPKFDVNCLKEKVEDYNKYKAKEKELESKGIYDEDVDDPSFEGSLPVTENYPYIKKGFKSMLKHFICLQVLKKVTKDVNTKLTNLKVEGKENLRGVKACIVTCNHASKVDSFAIFGGVSPKTMFVAADFNNWDNIIGEVARNTGYIPLPTNLNLKVMRKFNEAMEYYLTKKHKKVLIYPEQSMWREDPRPRPLKDGAFKYAAKHNVPILPTFITFKEKEVMEENGMRNFSDYTLHILKPIYPKQDLDTKQNIQYLKEENFRVWKELYEKVYNKKLELNIK